VKLAFCLFKYFPYGGMERNMLAIASACIERDHQVTVVCHQWHGPGQRFLEVIKLPVAGFTNAGRMKEFAQQVITWRRKNPVDLLVGFNKFPGLDIYYAADTCFAYRARHERNWLYRQLPRSRQYMAFERAVFSVGSLTEILEVSTAQRQRFVECYQTPEHRFHTLPPGIARNRVMPENHEEIRRTTRQALALEDNVKVLLTIGSDFQRKGVDRCIRALPALNRKVKPLLLLVVGKGRPDKMHQLADSLGVGSQVRLLGARDDVPALLQAADVFLHPAYEENTGNVILEAAIAGLPVVATDVCGYAHFIEDYQLGAVVYSPFQVENLVAKVASVLDRDRDHWRHQGAHLASTGDIFSRPQRAAEYIEAIGAKRGIC